MAKLRARSEPGSRFAVEASPREIGPCLEAGCLGQLVVAVAADETVISCSLCGMVWPMTRWLELREALAAKEVAA